MKPKSRGDMASAGITSAPSGATIKKSRITANCRKASDATTNVWYGVKRSGDFLSAACIRKSLAGLPNDIRGRGRAWIAHRARYERAVDASSTLGRQRP